MTQAISLISDRDRNPLNLVLGTHEIVDDYVDEIRGTKPWWRTMTPVERMEYLNQSAMTILDILKIPNPNKCGSTLEMGAFEPSTWSVFLLKPLFSEYYWSKSGTAVYDWKAIADQAGHVFHEYEHLAATFIAARYLGAITADRDKIAGGFGIPLENMDADKIASALGIPLEIAKAALSDPLPLSLIEFGKACHFRVTCEKNPAAPTDYYRSLHDKIKELQVEVKAAEKRLDELEHSSYSKGEYIKVYAQKRHLDDQLSFTIQEYESSESEIGSNVVENLVKSRLLQRTGARR